MATILLVGVDLFFRTKLEGLLPGHRLVTTDAVGEPDLVIADISRVEPEEVVDAWLEVPIVGFTNHTDRSGLQRAHTAGFDQVIVKSALVERAPELVSELTSAVFLIDRQADAAGLPELRSGGEAAAFRDLCATGIDESVDSSLAQSSG